MLKYRYSFYTRVIIICSYLFGSDHKLIGSLNRHLGNICRKQGDWKEAFEYFKKALSVYLVECPVSPEMSKLYIAIGNLSWEKNQLIEAFDYYEKAKVIDEKFNNREDIARDLNNLGLIKKEQGEYQESYDLFIESKKMYGVACGVTSDKVALVYMNLSGVLVNLNRLDEAFDYATSAVNIFENYHSGNLDQIAVCYDALGVCYYEKENFKKAYKLHNKALEIFKTIYKEEHVMVANNYLLAGKSKAALFDIYEAKECYNRSMKIYRSINSKNGCNFDSTIEMIQGRLTKLKGD